MSPSHLFLLAQDRSGSTWLKRTLDSHAQIGLYGELLNLGARPWDSLGSSKYRITFGWMKEYLTRLGYLVVSTTPEKALIDSSLSRAVRLLSTLSADYVGFKVILKYFQPKEKQLSFIHTFPQAKYLLLSRTDAFSGAISHFVGTSSGKWHSDRISMRQEHIFHIDPMIFQVYLQQRQDQLLAIKKLLNAMDVAWLGVTYEQLLGSHQKEELAKIAHFAKIPNDFQLSRLEKVTSRARAQKLIVNFDELEKLYGTGVLP